MSDSNLDAAVKDDNQTLTQLQLTLSTKTKITEKIAVFVEIVIGGTLGYVMYPLAEAFGIKINYWFNVADITSQETVKASFEPMLVLGVVNVQNIFESVAKYFTRIQATDKFLVKPNPLRTRTFSLVQLFLKNSLILKTILLIYYLPLSMSRRMSNLKSQINNLYCKIN